jgi:hypothetical protein
MFPGRDGRGLSVTGEDCIESLWVFYLALLGNATNRPYTCWTTLDTVQVLGSGG